MRSSAEPPSPVLKALEDDLNTPRALAEMFDLSRALNKTDDDDERRQFAAALQAAGDLVGLLQQEPEAWFAGSGDNELSADAIESLLVQREKARGNRDFAAADAIRDRLQDAGVTIEDGPSGTRWRRTG